MWLRWFRRSIASRLVVAILCILVVVMLAAGSLAIECQHDLLQESMNRRGQTLCEVVASSSIEPLLVGDIPVLETMVQQLLAKEPEIVCVRLFEGGTPVIDVVRDDVDADVELYTAPISVVVGSADPQGRVELGLSSARLEALMGSERGVALVIFGLAAVTIAVCLGWMLRRWVIWPLHYLDTRATQLGGGDLTTEISLRGEDELGRLGQTLARMRDALREKLEHLERQQAEIEQTQRELVEASRQAGMAEIATSVLHNVGNVLNSLTVSVSVLGERLKGSKLDYLGQVVRLLEEHASDLGSYVTHDPSGSRLPALLGALDDQLTGEHRDLLEEVGGLRRSVVHMRDIVTQQQSYARVSGVREDVDPCQLAEDALRLRLPRPAASGIELVRELAEVPRFSVERHRVLQILVNLISNARQAIAETGRGGRLVVRVFARDGDIHMQVEDDGVGIGADLMGKVFSYGFTTKPTGHGFGLHHSINTAREMGGSITAESPGPGCGATFTLTLPIDPDRDEAAPSAVAGTAEV